MGDFLEGMLQRDKDDFTRVCNRLLSNCFLCKGNSVSRSDYYFVLKYKERFSDYLSIAGYRLEINEEYGYLRYDYKKTRKNQRMCPARLGGWMGTYAH